MDTNIRVNGMTCNHCKKSVEDALKALAGVTSAQVDLSRGIVQVSFDPAQVDEARLGRAIEEVGFDVA